MMKENYSIQELAEAFGVSERTVLRKIKTISDKLGQVVLDSRIPINIANLIQKENKYKQLPGQNQDKTRTNQDNFDHIEAYTEQEYQELQKRIIEYPLLVKEVERLKTDIEYHKKMIASKQQLIENTQEHVKILVEGVRQRNYIEAKEKGLDK